MRFRNAFPGTLLVTRKTKNGFEVIPVEAGAEVELSEEDIAFLESSFTVSDWFKDGWLVEVSSADSSYNELKALAKAPAPQFRKRIKELNQDALKALLDFVSGKKKEWVLKLIKE